MSTQRSADAAGWYPSGGSGFTDHVGPFERLDVPGESPRFRVKVQPQHLNLQGRTHGGMLATILDTALGYSVLHAEGGRPCVTVQLGIQYISAGKLGDTIEARSRIVRRTRSLVFMEGALWVGDTEIATASGVWKIISSPGASLAAAAA